MISILILLWNWQKYVYIIVICYFVSDTMINSWDPNLIVENGWVNGYDVNDNGRNDVLTNIDTDLTLKK